ncbi:uncharacterized protein LOC131953074 [Physella acuta]|uniref:uncharacterized protein LOC131953074 n=1 Tax=Physella acuta TaxID=109671 RepID=UPI0027DCDC43|nr:uncharacterized protein LOC131953074 [Physella acuta]
MLLVNLFISSVTLVAMVTATVHPTITFRLLARIPGRFSYTHDVKIETVLEYQLWDHLCKTPGNPFAVRIGPDMGSTDIINEDNALHNGSEGAKYCLISPVLNPVKCDHENYCTSGNVCQVTLKSICPKKGKISRWANTERVDVTLDIVDGELKVVTCYGKCVTDQDDDTEEDEAHGISYLAVGFIVAGVIVAASLMVIGAVVWKIRSTRRLDPDKPHHQHHIEYAK